METLVVSKKKNTASVDREEKKPIRKGHADSYWMSDEVYAAFNAYLDSREIKEKKVSIFDYAMKLFLTERGFWPWPKPEE